MKSTTLIMLEEQLKWAYQGSPSLNGRVDWNKVAELKRKINAVYDHNDPNRANMEEIHDSGGW